MLEPWRSHYLRALGVDIYLPRYPLPAAARSIDIGWDEAIAVESELPIELPEITSEPAVTPARRPAAAATLIDVQATATPVARSASPMAAGTSSAPSLRIKLMIAVSDSGVLIIDDALGTARNDGQRLFANLLFALQGKPAALKVEPFDWPLPTLRNRAIELDENAARETLVAFLGRKIADGNIHTVLLLGANAQRWVDTSARQMFANAGRLHWGVSLSAAAILSDPRLKRQWWQELRGVAAQH